jgi:hypothetical protein
VKAVVKLQLSASKFADLNDSIGPNGVAARNLEWEAECLKLFEDACGLTGGLEKHASTLVADHYSPIKPIPQDASVLMAYHDVKKHWLWETQQVDTTTKIRGLPKFDKC